MERYNINKKKKDKNDSRTYYASIIYPKPERSVDDIYIRARLGDRLDHLAFEYYNDVTLWWIIAEANNIGKGTMSVPIGMQLRIPQQTDKIIEEYNQLVRERRIV